jgi:hypothetical protein
MSHIAWTNWPTFTQQLKLWGSQQSSQFIKSSNVPWVIFTDSIQLAHYEWLVGHMCMTKCLVTSRNRRCQKRDLEFFLADESMLKSGCEMLGRVGWLNELERTLLSRFRWNGIWIGRPFTTCYLCSWSLLRWTVDYRLRSISCAQMFSIMSNFPSYVVFCHLLSMSLQFLCCHGSLIRTSSDWLIVISSPSQSSLGYKYSLHTNVTHIIIILTCFPCHGIPFTPFMEGWYHPAVYTSSSAGGSLQKIRPHIKNEN